MNQASTNQKAVAMYREYRAKAENAAQIFSELRTTFPLGDFPKHAKRTWRLGMLAEMWAVIATGLNKDGRNYIEEWRTGK